jgi:hypothetical protein
MVRPWQKGLLGLDLGPFGPDLGRQGLGVAWWQRRGDLAVVVARARDGCLAMATRASMPGSGPNLDVSLVEVVLACWGTPVRRCSWSLKWAASRRRSFTTSTLGCCPIGAYGLCRCLPARDCGGRAGSDLGLAGVERVLVIAPLPICKFKLLLGSVSAGSGCL